jgi:hypothetical protein
MDLLALSLATLWQLKFEIFDNRNKEQLYNV